MSSGRASSLTGMFGPCPMWDQEGFDVIGFPGSSTWKWESQMGIDFLEGKVREDRVVPSDFFANDVFLTSGSHQISHG